MWTIILGFAKKNVKVCLMANALFAVQSLIASNSMLLLKELAHASKIMACFWLFVAIVGAIIAKFTGAKGNDITDGLRNDLMFEGRVIMLRKLDRIKSYPNEKDLRAFIEHDSIAILNGQITIGIYALSFGVDLLISGGVFWAKFGFNTMVTAFTIAITIVAVILLMLIPIKRYSKTYDKVSAEFRKVVMGFSALFMEYFMNNNTKYARSKIHEEELTIHEAFAKKRAMKNAFSGTSFSLRLMGAIVAVFILKMITPENEFDIESAILFGGMFSQILYPFFQLINMIEEQIELSVVGKRVDNILNLDEIDDQEKKIELHEKISTIQFDNVKFTAIDENGESHDVINGVDLTIHAGQRIGLAGASGAGKSSLVKMLYLKNEVTSGHIYINGRDINEYTRTSILANMYVVAQEARALEGTVADNLKVANHQASDEAMKTALKKAGLGYLNLNEMVEGAKARALSGGERQRLSIAKMFLRPEAQIIVLDEATSALDELTQYEIIKAVKEWAAEGNRIIISIAHRLSTIQSSDVICYMIGGKIAEKGTHDELMALNGHYAILQNASRNL